MLKIFENEVLLAQEVSSIMAALMAQETAPLFCLAAGETPNLCYSRFAEKAAGSELTKKLRFIGLDEWVGVPRASSGSCYHMMEESLFAPIGAEEEQILFFDVENKSAEQECRKMDRFLETNRITFSLMGVGMNGHIGLNEPGLPSSPNSRVVKLSDTTKAVAPKYFDRDVALEYGVTLSIPQIADSKKVIVIITGQRKQEIVRETLCNPEKGLPVQELLNYENVDLYLDKAAAALIDFR